MFMRCAGIAIMLAFACSLATAAQIHEASRDGRLDDLSNLLNQDPTLLNATDESGRTPLHWACRGVHEEIARFLVEQGADVDIRDQYLVTPLHSAAARGNVSVSRMLIEHGADTDVRDVEAHTPLHFAAIGGHTAAAALLIERGADLETRDDWGRTPLVLAAREMGGADVIRVLLDGGADIDSQDNYGATALNLAAWRGTADVVDLLIDRGAGIPTEGLEARQLLVYAASKGLRRLFTIMVEQGTGLVFETEYGGDLLHSAAQGGDPGTIGLLIERGFDPGRPDINGWTPLHFAADMNRAEAARSLVEAGSAIDARNLMGQTAYNIAEEWGYTTVLEVLAGMGANSGPPEFPELRGPYLGQDPPGDSPEIFARGIVMGRFAPHSAVAFSPDGSEVMWSQLIPPRESGYGSGRTMVSRVVDGKWTYPREAVFDGVAVDDCPLFSADGRFLYDIARRPLPGESASGRERIWKWTRRGDRWADPQPLDPAINTLSLHWQFAVDRQGNVYFSTRRDDSLGGGDIYCSEFTGGSHQAPYNLGDSINSEENEGAPFIDPDGRYLLFSRAGDLFVSFRKADDSWTKAVSLGGPVNTPAFELCPTVSPDGKYLFYLTEGGLKWVRAGIIDEIGDSIPGR